ncbi:hypothetical protein [Sphingomonas melonis]|uniref:Uncharacterized protein n=1 Tax=Sphingomonas melonis TaxID=152682 RepID=A0A7Y9K1N7_9SPHN|nr:hypothetical protein [Sphingomonas melonis]NYD89104.1 hypothetical protein [Sphingomonas melonis]
MIKYLIRCKWRHQHCMIAGLRLKDPTGSCHQKQWNAQIYKDVAGYEASSFEEVKIDHCRSRRRAQAFDHLIGLIDRTCGPKDLRTCLNQSSLDISTSEGVTFNDEDKAPLQWIMHLVHPPVLIRHYRDATNPRQ